MKEPLKVGDRVRVYGGAPHTDIFFDGTVGEVLKNDNSNKTSILVKMSRENQFWFFPQQLRRLKIKKRREIWVNEYKDDDGNYYLAKCNWESLELAKTKIGVDDEFIKTTRFFEGKEKK